MTTRGAKEEFQALAAVAICFTAAATLQLNNFKRWLLSQFVTLLPLLCKSNVKRVRAAAHTMLPQRRAFAIAGRLLHHVTLYAGDLLLT